MKIFFANSFLEKGEHRFENTYMLYFLNMKIMVEGRNFKIPFKLYYFALNWPYKLQ